MFKDRLTLFGSHIFVPLMKQSPQIDKHFLNRSYRGTNFKVMSTVKNKVQLIGNIGKDPEIRTLESGRKMAKFSIATDDSYRTAGGEWNTETQWHNIVAWGKMADKAADILTRGCEVSLEGKLMNNSYTDKNGVKKYFTQVQASNFELVVKEEKAVEEAEVVKA